MRRDPATNTLKPALKPEELYSMAPKIRKHADVDIKFVTKKDSSDLTANDWKKMCDAIHDNMDKYDAVVMTHGTDTMAHTANAIAYAFGKTLKIPVVMTGAQCEPDALGTDAIANIERAFLAATTTTRPEVMVSFNHAVFRGTRVRKIDETNLAAFGSPAALPLATFTGGGIEWRVKPNPKRDIAHGEEYSPFFNDHVLTTSMESGMSPAHLKELFVKKSSSRIQGIVWSSLGQGNIPQAHYKTIVEAQKLGIPIVVTAANAGGRLNMQNYATGAGALKLGVIPAHNMTPEAASSKLKWLLGRAEVLNKKGQLKQSEVTSFVKKGFEKKRAKEVNFPKKKQGNIGLPAT